MNTPHGGGRAREPSSATGPSVGPLEHYSCALTGLVATAVVAVLFYPTLVALTRPFAVLSSTALVFAVILAWLLTWATLELGWELAAGRLTLRD